MGRLKAIVLEWSRNSPESFAEWEGHELEFHASFSSSDMHLASDSLPALKKKIRERGYRLAWISCTNGCLSYGQNIVNEYPYQPRYYNKTTSAFI